MVHIRFEKPEEYPVVGDYIPKVFPYIVEAEGEVDALERSKRFTVLVKLTGALKAIWEIQHGRTFTQNEIEAILFAFARQHVTTEFNHNGRFQDSEIRLEPSCGMPEVVPFDLSAVGKAEGATIELAD